MRTISLKVPDDIDARLTAEARLSGRSKSEVIRRAIVKLVPPPKSKAPANSFGLLAADVIGCVAGDPGLSMSEDWDDFGR